VDSEITLSVLREIRDAVVATNWRIDSLDRNLSARIDQLDKNLSARIDQANARIDNLDKNLSARIDQTNARLDETNARLSVVEHVVKDAAEQIVFLGRYAKNSIEDLRERVTRLEAKVDT
jgi:methyl-accepting chemotaxis protein